MLKGEFLLRKDLKIPIFKVWLIGDSVVMSHSAFVSLQLMITPAAALGCDVCRFDYTMVFHQNWDLYGPSACKLRDYCQLEQVKGERSYTSIAQG
jgi:hypothetical protein